MATLANESCALLLSSRVEGPSPQLRRLLNEPLDWSKLFHLACSEQAVWPLWTDIVASQPRGVPAREFNDFRRLAAVAEFRQTAVERCLEQAIGALAELALPVVLLKGAALAKTHYESINDRPMCDLDLLVPKRQAQEARNCLVAAGWEQREPAGLPKPHHHLPALTDPDRVGVKLELHTEPMRLHAPFDFSARVLRERSLLLSEALPSIRVPTPEDQLLHLCLHFAWSNRLARNAWLALRDIDRIVSAGLDWEVFESRAIECRGATCCYWTLRLARDLVGIRLPETSLSSLAPRLSEPIQRAACRHFAGQLLARPRPTPPGARRFVWSLAIQPRRSGHGSIHAWGRATRFHVRFGRLPSQARRALSWVPYARMLLRSKPI